MTCVCASRFAAISSSSGSTADWPRSMIDSPPIWITFSIGRIARTGASVLAMTSLYPPAFPGEVDLKCIFQFRLRAK